jgi:hypothetical protein
MVEGEIQPSQFSQFEVEYILGRRAPSGSQDLGRAHLRPQAECEFGPQRRSRSRGLLRGMPEGEGGRVFLGRSWRV